MAKTGSFITGVLLGGAIGTLTGLLMAPRTGRETRQTLRKSVKALPELAEDLSTTVQMQVDRFSETALRNWDRNLELEPPYPSSPINIRVANIKPNLFIINRLNLTIRLR